MNEISPFKGSLAALFVILNCYLNTSVFLIPVVSAWLYLSTARWLLL